MNSDKSKIGNMIDNMKNADDLKSLDKEYYNILVLRERSRKIQSVISDYGEDQFYIAFSGGKDSCVLSELIDWAIPDNKIPIIGVMRDEGGGRNNSNCMNFKDEELKSFQPLVKVTKEWEDWFILNFDIKICDIYKEPYNFPRTGCKGCPFNFKLQHELDILEKYFPEERKQCELIWGPVYDEYRRIGYRLNK